MVALLVAGIALAQAPGATFQPGEKVEVHGWVPFGEGVVIRREGTRYLIRFRFGEPSWVPEEYISKVEAGQAVPPAGPPDLAPLYQAIGAAAGAIGCCVVPVVLMILASLGMLRRSAESPPRDPPAENPFGPTSQG